LHDVEARLLRALLVAARHVDAVGAVLVDDRDAEVLGILAELFLRVLGEEVGRHQPELASAGLRAEDVLQVPVLEHRRGDAGGDPHELLELLDPGGDGDALRRGVEAEQHVHLLLLDQADGLVDGDVGLALRVGVHRLDLVAADAALLGEVVDHDLGAERVELGPAARERPGVVIDHADLDLLALGLGVGDEGRTEDQRRGDQPEHKTTQSL
jgi:hypothetical protein